MPATLKDIAQETGLSIATVSKYLNGVKLREENRIAIEQAIQKLGYTVNEYARGLKLNRSHTIGVVIPDLTNLFVSNILVRMEEILREHGYSIMICDCHNDLDLERETVQFLMGRMVDVLVNMPVCATGEHLRPALLKRTPVLVLDRVITELKGEVDSIFIDNVSISRQAVQKLLQQGHREIGVIVGPMSYSTSRERLEGYLQALHEAQIPEDYGLIEYSDFTLQGGYKSMCRLLERHPRMTAVFPTNYEMTLGAFIALNDHKIRIPEELSFVGFDDMGLSKVTNPSLTVAVQPLEQLGTHAANCILNRLIAPDDPSLQLALSATIKEGASVGPPREKPEK